ncbi:hypothetical protein M5K25_021098 [Dendrobium thyrsiflorum]|uniref:Uncharacterized protein n=1 Tax=Dendrobium thyrsiflorum TaxID=117978 RepID=A0ABD0UBI4_DENTH
MDCGDMEARSKLAWGRSACGRRTGRGWEDSEKYWEDHPGEAVPLMRPKFYWGPWRIYNGDTLPPMK